MRVTLPMLFMFVRLQLGCTKLVPALIYSLGLYVTTRMCLAGSSSHLLCRLGCTKQTPVVIYYVDLDVPSRLQRPREHGWRPVRGYYCLSKRRASRDWHQDPPRSQCGQGVRDFLQLDRGGSLGVCKWKLALGSFWIRRRFQFGQCSLCCQWVFFLQSPWSVLLRLSWYYLLHSLASITCCKNSEYVTYLKSPIPSPLNLHIIRIKYESTSRLALVLKQF